MTISYNDLALHSLQVLACNFVLAKTCIHLKEINVLEEQSFVVHDN